MEIWHLPAEQGQAELGILESWNDGSILAAQGKNPSCLLLIPVAAMEIHPKPWPHHQPCKELKKLPSKFPPLKTDTPNLALELFPGVSRLQKPSEVGTQPDTLSPLECPSLEPAGCSQQ